MRLKNVAIAAYARLYALKTDRRAVTAIEYALIAAVMAGVVAAAFSGLGSKLSTEFTNIGSKLTVNAAS